MATLFPILLEVEPPALGKVLLRLRALPGVTIHFNLDAAGSPKKNGTARLAEAKGHPRTKKDPGAPTGKSIIIAELMSGQKNLAHLRAKFAEHHMSPGNATTAVYELTKSGITEHIGVGLYQLSDAALKELQADKAAPPPQLPAPVKSDRGASRPFVLKCISEGKTRLEMCKAGELVGINERMIDGALTRLKKEKQIASVEGQPGHFKLAPQRAGKSKQS